MKNFVFGILVTFISFVNAQVSQNIFEKANKVYQTEDYSKAITLYQSVLDQGLASSELYFNLGNAYYKTNQMAAAIYHYEKALILNPSNQDAKINLSYANRSIIDSIKIIPKSIFEKFNDTVLSMFSYNSWAKIAVSLSLIAGLLWMLFFFTTQPAVKKLHFTLAIVFTFVCLVSLIITHRQYNRAVNTIYAIIFTDEVEVKNAPRKSANEIFTLHEGTKVKVLDKVGDWQKVKIADGQVGWLPKEVIKTF